MATCNSCNQEMLNGVGCTLTHYEDYGPRTARIPYPADKTAACHDCRCPPGALHHPGCDGERCPFCGGQAIGCDCGSERIGAEEGKNDE